jgi:hypothetical protein
MSVRPLSALVLVASFSVAARAASAQDVAAGQSLYEAGVKAYADGDLAHACPSFQQSFAADRQPAPLFMLAKCEEKQGRIASALDHFEEVLRLGGLEPELRDQAAQSVTRLGPRVPRVTLMRGAAPAAAVAKIDGVVVAIEGRPVPLDPGEHELVVEAAERAPFIQKFTTVESESKSLEVQVGAPLPKKPDERPATPPTAVAAEADSSGLWIGAAIAGGVGLAGFVLAGVTGGIILDDCGGSLGCVGRTADSPSDGLLGANYAGWGLGAVGITTGAVLLVVAATSGSGDTSPPQAGGLRLVPGPAPLGLGGALSF